MHQENYLKEDFFKFLRLDDDLFDAIVVANQRYFFVWDYQNQDYLWLSKPICKKLGFKAQKSDLTFWPQVLHLPKSSSFNSNVNQIAVEVTNSKREKQKTLVTLFKITASDNSIKRIVGIIDGKSLFQSSAQKIKKRQKFQDFLLENQDRFKFISENISDGIYIIENEKLVFASGAYLKMMKLTEQQKQQNHKIDMFNLVHPDDLEVVKKTIYGAAENKLPSIKYVFRCRDGEGNYVWREDIMNIQYDNNGKPFRVVTIARDITQEKEQEIEEEKRQKATDLQNQLLINLYSNTSDRDVSSKIKEVTTLAAEGLNIERVSFWEVRKNHLVCMNLYDKVENSHTKNQVLNTRKIPKYITAVNKKTVLVADNVYDNENTSELIDNYLKPLGITDMLDVPIRANGKLFGVLCCEHRDDPRVWSENDISFARALADYLSLTLEEDKRKKAEAKLNENQEKLKFISENTSDGILVIEDNKITYVSPVFTRLTGYTQEYIENLELQDVFGFIHPEDVVKISEIIKKNFQSQNARFSYEYRLKALNGEYQWREDSANVIFNNDGSYSKYILVSRDITERKSTEKQLIESEQQLRLITENTSDGVAVIENGKLTYVSPSYVKLLNYPKEVYLNFTPDDIYSRFHPDDLLIVKPYITQNLFNKLKEFKYELRFRDAYGEYHWREDSANVIYDEDGKYSKYIVVTRDISKRKEAEKEKNRLYEITEKQNQKLINFTHIVSHDIRSHTSNLSMILDLFEETQNAEEQKEYFSMLKQSTAKLSDTIFFLNQTVAIQSGVKQDVVNLNLKNEIKKAILGINAIIKSSKAVVEIEVDDSIEIEATQSYFESIIFNLLTNAIKYRSKNRNPVIKISAKKTTDELVVSIQDNGLGIDLEKNKDKIFGMYKTFHGNEDAVGLGLFMVKNHIEAMGGRVEVESAVEVGTRFNLYFI